MGLGSEMAAPVDARHPSCTKHPQSRRGEPRSVDRYEAMAEEPRRS